MYILNVLILSENILAIFFQIPCSVSPHADCESKSVHR